MRAEQFRGAFAGITTRGTSFLTAGLVAMVCAFLLQQADLVRVASLLAALPVVAVLWMAAQRFELVVTRTCDPPSGTVGEQLRVSVRVANRSTSRTSALLFEDTLPPGLTALTRVVVPPLLPRETAHVSYLATADRRGRFRLGPARLVAVEPFGLVERTWRAGTAEELLVRPRVQELDGILPVRRAGRGGDSDHGGVGVVGDPDLSVREYRHGDDLRRVHWPTTARRGQLMVRPEQQPQDHNAVVLVDSRAIAHRGDAETGSLELAVSAAASVLVHVARTGHRVVLVGDGEQAGHAGHETLRSAALSEEVAADAVEEGLDRLAVLGRTGEASLSDAVEEIAHSAPSLVVAVLGEVGPEDVETLAGSARDAVRSALVCVTTSWEHLGGARRRLVDDRREAAVARLSEAGWRVVQLRHGDDVAQAWLGLGAAQVPA